MIIPVNMKPMIYPPVGPMIADIPDLKDENTGNPIIPSNIHKIIDKVPLLPPSKRQVINIPNVCSVIGIVNGMDIYEQIAIIIANIDTCTKSFILLFIYVLFIYIYYNIIEYICLL